MAERVILGNGRHFENLSRDSWEQHVAIASQHIPAVLEFMTAEHHLVRNFVVKEIALAGTPVSPEQISAALAIPQAKVIAQLDDLEKNLFFLVRDSEGNVSWAFPATAEKTPHRMTFNTGEKVHAA